MKKIFVILLLAASSSAFAQQQKNNPAPKIRQFWFVMLTAGPNRSQDSATAARIQEGHMANIRSMSDAGKLKVAGPFGDDGNWKGIFILDCATKEEAEQLLAKDPAVAAGRLNYEIRPWYTMPSGSFAPVGKRGRH